MIALPMVPSRQEKRQDLARDYYRLHGKCLFCDYAQFELKEKVKSLYDQTIHFSLQVRIVEDTSHFVAVVPFAANIPYHTCVFPKKHHHQVGYTTDDSLFNNLP